MADSRAGARKIQETSGGLPKIIRYLKNDGDMSEGHRSQLKGPN